MRSAWHNWFLRFCALLIFISGGALARAVAKEIQTNYAPLERPIEEKNLKPVIWDVRQPTPVQLDGAIATPHIAPLEVRLSRAVRVAEQTRAFALVLRMFDALAPPQVA